MRILRLGSSGDLQPDVPDHLRSYRVIERELGAASGEPVETVLRSIWPSEKLPGLIDGWIDELRPDLVYFRVNPFWYSYESVPLRLNRKLGRVGGAVSRAGIRAGTYPGLAASPVFRFGRDVALRAIGGDPWFTPDQVLATTEECMGHILRHEGVGLLVAGMLGRRLVLHDGAAGERRRQEKRLYIHARLQELCAARHIGYLGWVEAEAPDVTGPDFAADQLHRNTLGQELVGGREAEAMIEVWRATAGAGSAP